MIMTKKAFLLLFCLMSRQVICTPCCSVNPAPIQTITNTSSPIDLAFSPDGSCLAVLDQLANQVLIYPQISDCVYDTTPITIPTDSFPVSMSFSPSGNCFAVGNSVAGTVQIFTRTTGCNFVLATTIPGFLAITQVAISPTGTCLAVADQSASTVFIYPLNAACAVVGSPTTITGLFPAALAFSPSGNCLAVGDNISAHVNIYPLISGCTYSNVATTAYTGLSVEQLLFSHDGSCLIIGASPNRVTTYPLISGCTYAMTASSTIITPLANILSLSLTSSDSCLAVISRTTALASTRGISLDPVLTVYTALSPCIYNTTPNVTITLPGSPGVARYSPVSNCIAAAAANTVLIYSTAVTAFSAVVSPASITVASGSTVTLTTSVSGGTAPYAFSWVGPNGFTATTQSITINNIMASQAGTYTVTVNDAAGCQTTASALVTVDSCATLIATVTPPAAQIPLGSNITFTGSATGGIPPYIFTWTGPLGFVSHNAMVSIFNASFNQAGIYTFSVTDSFGCSTEITFLLTVLPHGSPLSQAIKTKYCPGITV